MNSISKKFSKVSLIFYIIGFIGFLLMNLTTFYLGNHFANQYGADHYKIGYHKVNYVEFNDVATDQPAVTYYHSFFYYYDAAGNDYVLNHHLEKEYNSMNLKIDNLYQGFLMFSVIVFMFSFSISIYFFLKRVNFNSLLIGGLIYFLIFLQTGMLSIWTVIYLILLGYSLFLVKKIKFVDYNERSLFYRNHLNSKY